jgi:hypothetical protein
MVDRTNKPMEWKREETDEAAGGALDATGVYETATGVVLYDSEEPLAWVQADNAVKLDEIA